MRRNLSRQAQKRLMNELDGWFEGSPVPGMKVLSADSLDEWLVELVGAENTVYANERYFLKFRFPEDYPFEPPEITFQQPAPQHPHVYTNGHSEPCPHEYQRIESRAACPLSGKFSFCLTVEFYGVCFVCLSIVCLNILFDGWSPALTVTSICLSILSMLSSANRKGIPPDNDTYVAKSHGKSPKETRWMFHDDSV